MDHLLRRVTVRFIYACALLFVTAPSIAQVPVDQFANFESAHVHPLELTPDGSKLLAVNTANNTLEVFNVNLDGSLQLAVNIPVGHDPVSVRARNNNEVWVANVISDTVSIVDLNLGAVVRTLQTQNEPSDIVFAGNPERAFVSCAERESVQVFNPANLNQNPTEVLLIGEQPRALAVSNDGNTVYAAFFESGNQTTVIPGNEFIANGGLLAPFSGTTIVPNDVQNTAGPYGGAVPVPNDGNNFSPPLNPALPAKTDTQSLVVKKQPDGTWLDDNNGDWTSIVTGGIGTRSSGWDLADRDVAIIDANSLSVSYQNTLGNILMAMSVHPTSDDVYVVGTDAMNQIRFEPNLNGTFMRHNLSRFTPGNSSATITDLNPHLNYLSPTVTNPQKAQSVGDPRAVEWLSDGSAAWISSMGTNGVIKIDANGDRIGNPIAVGEGPTGIAIHESSGSAYVLNKFDASISTVDLLTNEHYSEVFFYDPTPQVIKVGRPHLYDTFTGSGNGTISCASCHVDGKWDRLAWDLGNPAGEMETTDDGRVLHPLKGLKTTQTLIDIISSGLPLHWRGDRSSFRDFHLAFENLKGREPVSEEAMVEFEDFIATTYYPPNPFQEATNNNNLLPSMIRGPGTTFQNWNLAFQGPNAIGAWHTACGGCHQNDSGKGPPGAINLRDSQYENQDNIAADLRMFYRKNGFYHDSDQSTAGFGLFSDGIGQTQEVPRTGYWFDYHGILFGGFPGGGPVANQFGPEQTPHTSQNSHYETGRQVTINGAIGSVNDANTLRNLSNNSNVFPQLRQPDLGLVVHGIYQGEQRGFVHTGGDTYQADSDGETVSHQQLIAAAQAGNNEPLTWTLVHDHVANRLGVDRNANGILDQDDFADADNDGVPDEVDLFPNDPSESADADNDGIGNNADDDDDNDGVLDDNDQMPFNPNESIDSDADGIGNNADNDDDGDGVADADDAFPLNFDESSDADGDGIGDNADNDADNDGIPNENEAGGDSDIVILAGKIGSEYNLSSGSQLSLARSALLDTNNYGPSGTVEVDSLTILEDVGTITAASLQNVDIMFDGWVEDSAWNTAEFNAIDAWVRNGGILITTNDDTGHDGIATFYGAPVAGTATQNWVPDNSVHPVVIGPFGTWSSIAKLGNFSFFNVPNGWTSIVEDTAGRTTILEGAVGSGHVIIIGDEGTMRNSASGNQIMTRNLFAYAIDLLPKVAGDQDDDGIENQLDLDSDNDSIPDVIEAGGADANNDGLIDDASNNQGSLLNLADTDNNGLPDFLDPNGNAVFPNPITDSDGDGWEDSADGNVNNTPVNPEPPVPANPNGGIVVNGNFDDWSAITAHAPDPDDVSGANNALDFASAQLAHDNDNLYIRYDNHAPDAVQLSWGMSVQLDTDNNPATGFRGFAGEFGIGVDYIVEGNALHRYTGNGTNYSWADEVTIPAALEGASLEMAIPLDEIGNPVTFRLFYFADNVAIGGSAVDFYPDAAGNLAAPVESRSFLYNIDGVVVTPPAPEPTPDGISNPATLIPDGNLSDWSGLTSFGPDPDDASGAGNELDWREGWVAHDDQHFYFGWRNDQPAQLSWGNGIMLDTDQNVATGFRGFSGELPTGVDYLLEADTIHRYTGTGTDWMWENAGTFIPAISGTDVEIQIPRSQLGNPTAMNVFFSADNEATGGNVTDYYPDAATDPAAPNGQRSFAYTTGTSNPPVIPAVTIVLDGNLNEWPASDSLAVDDAAEMSAPNVIDWRRVLMTNNDTTLYIGYQNHGPAQQSWGYQIYMDTDNNRATGFTGFSDEYPIGADYVLEGDELNKFSGASNTEWGWASAGVVQVAVAGDSVEVAIPRSLMGNPAMIDSFARGDNNAVGGNQVDFYPDAANNPNASLNNRHFSYNFAASSEPAILAALPEQTSGAVKTTGSGALGLEWLLLAPLWAGFRRVRLSKCKPFSLFGKPHVIAMALAATTLFLTACDSGKAGSGNTNTGSSNPANPDTSGPGNPSPGASSNTGGSSDPNNNPSFIENVNPPASNASFADAVTGELNGSSAYPPVGTAATGTATMLLNPSTGQFAGRVEHTVAETIAVEIRDGGPQQSGPTILQLEQQDAQTYVIPDNTVLTAPQINALQNGQLHVIVASSFHPYGEIRAQLISE